MAALARELAAKRDSITARWMEAVRDDPQIPSADRLTLSALEDHFPDMLSELIAALDHPAEKVNSAEAQETGSEHGKGRWRNGYRLDEVLRELARIREIVLAQAETYGAEHLNEEKRKVAGEKIRLFFDTIAATSAQQFIREQEAEVILRTRQLQHAYEQVQAATEQVRELSHSRLRLLRSVSHELRNLLNAVNLSAVTLLEESNPTHREELAASLTRSVGHLQALLDRLHQFSKVLSGEEQPELADVNLTQFMAELEGKYRPIAERNGLAFETECSIDDAVVKSDPGKLRDIADNLLSNAISFTPSGLIRVSIAGIDPDRWVLRVEDTGLGIPAADARHIFSEFHYGSDARLRQGVGLGLAITRHLVHLHGGEITFRSEVGRGTEFEVNLPRK